MWLFRHEFKIPVIANGKKAFFSGGEFVDCIQEYFARPFLRSNLPGSESPGAHGLGQFEHASDSLSAPRLWESRHARTWSVLARLEQFECALALKPQARTDLVSFSAPRLLG
jgi:hypothetical protein